MKDLFKNCLTGIVILVLAFVLTGCGVNIPNEIEIKEDLKELSNLSIDKITIEQRDTIKKSKDVINVEVISSNELWQETSYYELIYTYDDTNKSWILSNYEERDLDKWVDVPKLGVTEEIINEYIKAEETADEYAKIKLSNRQTDLENKTEIITFSYEYDDEILVINGTFDVVYKFEEKAWRYDSKTNESLEKKWNISGIWEQRTTSSSRTLEITEENEEITGVYKNILTGLFNDNTTYTFTSGTFKEGQIEMHGTYKSNSSNTTKSCVLTGTINSKDKTITISITNFLGTPKLTKIK